MTGTISLRNGWRFALPLTVMAAALEATLVIGAVAGFYPAVRATRIPPTAALAS